VTSGGGAAGAGLPGHRSIAPAAHARKSVALAYSSRVGDHARVRAELRVLLATLPGAATLLFAFAWQAAAQPVCQVDDRLAEAAAALLLRAEPITPARLVAEVRAHGYDGMGLRAREVSCEAPRLREDGLECGEARTEARCLIVTGRRLGSLVREGRRVRGSLAAGFTRPELVIESARGELSVHRLSLAELEAGVLLPNESEPRKLQLVAEGAGGPRPVAELVFVQTQQPASAEAADDERTPAALLGEVQAFRRARGVGKLRENKLLSQSAARHAAKVCEAGELAHRWEGEDPELRLRREHVAARAVGEAIARAQSPGRAFAAMVESPAHRLALHRREFTDVGIGLARDPKQQVCLVVLLAAWPRRIP
jgi:uncharacterized protein YkwD